MLVSCGSRTGLGDETYTTDTLYCASQPVSARPNFRTTLFAGIPRYARGAVGWNVLTQPAGASVTLTHMNNNAADFTADREGAYVVRVSIPDAPTGDGGANDGGGRGVTTCDLNVTVRVNGPAAVCPPEVTVTPLQRVSLVGRSSSERPITTQRWTLQGAPTASARPSPTPDDAATMDFTPDVAGDYRLQYEVTDDRDRSDRCSTLVHAVPVDGLRVEMFWDPPGRTCPNETGAACDGSDVDLHVLRASQGLGWGSDDDCNWFNCNVSARRFLSWSAPGANDDPRLDIDDVNGHGPENVNIRAPTERSYRIGAHYYNAHGAGPQAVTVLVYCNRAQPIARFGPVTLTYRGSRDDSDFWVIADVLPSGDTCSVRPILRDGAPWISSFRDVQRNPGPAAP